MKMSNMMSNVDMTYSLPILSFIETHDGWEAFITEGENPVISFRLRPVMPIQVDDGREKYVKEPPRLLEPFIMREKFFAIVTPQDALQFFQRYGPMQVARQWDGEAAPIRFSQVLRRRDFFLDALLNRRIPEPGTAFLGTFMDDLYLWQNLPLELVFRQPMQAIVRCKDVEDGLRATVFLDRLRQFPWQRCARPDCGKPFAVTTRKAKLYCSEGCSHLMAVRGYNDRKQLAKAAAKQPAKAKPTATKKPTGKKGRG